jgi:hypothetical protein
VAGDDGKDGEGNGDGAKGSIAGDGNAELLGLTLGDILATAVLVCNGLGAALR